MFRLLKRGFSIRSRTITALMILLFTLVVLFFFSIYMTGVMKSLDNYSLKALNNQVSSRTSEINSSFENRIEGSRRMAADIYSMFLDEMKKNDITIADFYDNPDIINDMLFRAGDIMIENMRYVEVTGAFIILDYSGISDDDSHAAIYLRDYSPGLITNNNTNLQLLYGPTDFSRQRSIALHSLWSYNIDFDSIKNINIDFYTNPIEAAINRPNQQFPLYAYACPPMQVANDGVKLITYTYPLLDAKGVPFGICGFELTEEYLRTMLPFSEISFQKGFYSILFNDGSGFKAKNAISSGSMAKQFLTTAAETINISEIQSNSHDMLTGYIWTDGEKNSDLISTSAQLKLYSQSSYYHNTDKWYLTGITPTEALKDNSHKVINSMIITTSVIFIAGLFLIFVIANIITSPIISLSKEVSSIDPEKPVKLKRSGLREIDTLITSFENLSDNLSDAAARLSKIVSLVDMPIGGFEINHTSGHVFLTESMYRITGIEPQGKDNTYLEFQAWEKFISGLEKISAVTINDVNECIYNRSSGEKSKWYRIKSADDGDRSFGLLSDITEEMLQKQRMAYERSYDQMTRLLNRQAFIDRVNAMIEAQPNKVGIMMFGDLDNLKYFNDSYGHDTGDLYLKKTAESLLPFKEIGGAIARISGDEFMVYIHGYDTDAEAREAFDSKSYALNTATMTTSDGVIHKIRISIGISYYPKDSLSVDELMRFSDFAMYEIKNTVKGSLREFEFDSYGRNALIMQKKSLLERFISEERLIFNFQPIIDIHTGEILAYEALMRPQIREFKTPVEALQIARANSMLYKMENLTFQKVYEWLSQNIALLGGKRIYINSISGEILNKTDFDYIKSKYGKFMKYTAIDLSDGENGTVEEINEKINIFRSMGCQIAVDDYGSGYINIDFLNSIKPDFIKIDVNVIHDIHIDTDRQNFVADTISYGKSRNIKIIAEGVEKLEELKTLFVLGVDYVQGYYFFYPSERLVLRLDDDQLEELRELGEKHL